ncbi:MAG: hypothetical protein JJ975_09865 [Bacteroidia bacterium]|nr:hypothetical protein [Bacteroidia bacterium]
MKFVRDTILPRCTSENQFRQELAKLGLGLYYSKDDQPQGILDSDGKRHSFKRCGITPQMWQALHRREEMHRINQRLSRLEQIHRQRQAIQTRDHEQEL